MFKEKMFFSAGRDGAVFVWRVDGIFFQMNIKNNNKHLPCPEIIRIEIKEWRCIKRNVVMR